jgi:hypothetical protein
LTVWRERINFHLEGEAGAVYRTTPAQFTVYSDANGFPE